jgi:hypothetical protein
MLRGGYERALAWMDRALGFAADDLTELAHAPLVRGEAPS